MINMCDLHRGKMKAAHQEMLKARVANASTHSSNISGSPNPQRVRLQEIFEMTHTYLQDIQINSHATFNSEEPT